MQFSMGPWRDSARRSILPTVAVLLFALIQSLCQVNAYPAAANIDPNNPLVQTKWGAVRGHIYKLSQTITQRQNTIMAFIGVPYGAPPTGVNRFRPPRLPIDWSGELDCNDNRRVLCPQVYQRFQTTSAINSIPEDEDCLHLNIYVPASRVASLPVLVYFHGGEFKYGGKDLFRPDFLLDMSLNSVNSQGMIVVTVNYRLGVLGFLSTDDVNQPGNNGIRDQVLALQWINQNIAKFNGNPLNVTIMGHDAGAVSVSMHILNPDASQYFSSAISISGSVFSPWAIEDNPVQQSREFGWKFSCDTRADRLIECLRFQDVGSLLSTSAERDWGNNIQPFWFKPVVDRNVTGSALLRDFPLNLYKSGQFARVPYLLVGNTNEGSLEYYLQANHLNSIQVLERKIAFLIRPFLKSYASEEIMSSAFSYKYFNRTQRSTYSSGNTLNSPFASNQFNNKPQSTYGGFSSGGTNSLGNGISGYTEAEANRIFVDMLTDFMYLGPMDYAARYHSEFSDTTMLIFGYLGQSKSFGPLQRDIDVQVSRDTYGVTHGQDLFFSFVTEYDLTSLQSQELTVARVYSQFISEFVLYGNALTRYSRYTSSVPNYNTIDNQYFSQIQPRPSQFGNGYRTQYSDFINNYIYQLQDQSAFFPPYFPTEEYKVFQSATWSLMGVLILLVVIVVLVAAFFLFRRRNEANDPNDNSENVTLKRRRDDNL